MNEEAADFVMLLLEIRKSVWLELIVDSSRQRTIDFYSSMS